MTLLLSGLKGNVVRRGADVKAKCVVTPARLANSKVTLTVERKNGSRWIHMKSATIRASRASGWRYKAPRTGAYRMRATLAETTAYFGARTAWHAFRVK